MGPVGATVIAPSCAGLTETRGTKTRGRLARCQVSILPTSRLATGAVPQRHSELSTRLAIPNAYVMPKYGGSTQGQWQRRIIEDSAVMLLRGFDMKKVTDGVEFVLSASHRDSDHL